MNCPRCGEQLPSRARFCLSCGADLTAEATSRPRICAVCGAELRPGDAACPRCETITGAAAKTSHVNDSGDFYEEALQEQPTAGADRTVFAGETPRPPVGGIPPVYMTPPPMPPMPPKTPLPEPQASNKRLVILFAILIGLAAFGFISGYLRL